MSLRSVFAFPLIQCLIFDNTIIFELVPTYVISKKCLWKNQSRVEIKGSVYQSKSLLCEQNLPESFFSCSCGSSPHPLTSWDYYKRLVLSSLDSGVETALSLLLLVIQTEIITCKADRVVDNFTDN